MTRTNRRGIDAARRIHLGAATGETAEPLAFVEAALLEREAKRRTVALEEAGERIANHRAPRAAFEEIVRAFFAELPRVDADPDDGPPTGESMRRRRFAKTEPDTRPAPAAVPSFGPTAESESETAKVGPLPEDGRRSLDELDGALHALGWAVLLDASLARPMRALADRLRDFARRTRDETTAASLRGLARRAGDYAKAAGTAARPDRPRAAVVMAQRAVERGADVEECERIAAACAEWDTLAQRGLVRMSRERFVDLAMTRFRQEHPAQ